MATRKAVKQAARTVVRTTSRAGGTPAEGVGVVRKAVRNGSLQGTRMVKQYRKTVRQELGAPAARKVMRAVKKLDYGTAGSPRKKTAATNAARRQKRKLT